MDEKSQVQALARSGPAFPMMPGMCEKRTHDYLRHGTTSLFAAFNTADGAVISSTHRRHRAVEFKKFVTKIDSQIPEHLDVHLDCDNYGTHKSPAIQRWLQAHPRFHMRYTPTYSSWINQAERSFASFTDDLLRPSVIKDLIVDMDAVPLSRLLQCINCDGHEAGSMTVARVTKVLAVGISALYYAVLRRWILTWGATAEEAASPLPGDELLETADGVSTRAIQIHAPASTVWPWIAQMGPSPRGGAYTYDWIENALGLDMHSADNVLREFQHPELGDTFDLRTGRMQLGRVETERVLAWRSRDANWVWTFALLGNDSQTRLISRNRFRRPTRLARTGMIPMASWTCGRSPTRAAAASDVAAPSRWHGAGLWPQIRLTTCPTLRAPGRLLAAHCARIRVFEMALSAARTVHCAFSGAQRRSSLWQQAVRHQARVETRIHALARARDAAMTA